MKYHLDRWFDKTARNWVVQKLDENGDQVGDAVVVGTRGEAMGIELDNPAFKSEEDKHRENEERYGKKRKPMNSFIARASSVSVTSGLSDRVLKTVTRAASTGSRVIADNKTIWPGSTTTVFNSRQAQEAWRNKGPAFLQSLSSKNFRKVVIKDWDSNGNWVTAEEFNL